MTRLLFVRHGETTWNKEQRIQGQKDAPLSEQGRQQALALGRRLGGTPITACFSSSLQRAMETAKLLLQTAELELPIVPMPEWMEQNFGEWEGLLWTEVCKRYPEEVQSYLASGGLTAPSGGESVTDVLERVRRGLERVLREIQDGTALIVAHGGSIKAAVCILFGLPLSSYSRLRLGNAGLTIVEVEGEKASLLLFNDACHVSPFQCIMMDAG